MIRIPSVFMYIMAYWYVLLAGLVAIQSLPTAPLPRGSSSSVVRASD